MIYLCWAVLEPWGCDNPPKALRTLTPHRKAAHLDPATCPRAQVTVEEHRRAGRGRDADGVRLPGIMGTADGFGRCTVTASRAGATSGGSSSSSSRAAVAPRIRGHAPGAKGRRKGHGLAIKNKIWQGSEKYLKI